ncbi:protein KTI12 [Nematocida sp. AWRm77]|nr:protein KTI12 [Nematocida sp. AWRm77]
MPLLALSGVSSLKKTEMFLHLVNRLKEDYKVLLVVQKDVGVEIKEEVATLRSLVQNRLRKDVLVAICAPLHMKSLRYEIFSIAKNMGIEYAHIVHNESSIQTEEENRKESGAGAGAGDDNRTNKSGFFEDMGSLFETIEIASRGEVESTSVLRRIFEAARRNDKWDCPVFCTTESCLSEGALGLVKASLQKAQKVRTSSTKIMPQHLDPTYLDKAKKQMDEAMHIYKAQESSLDISLKTARDIEGRFLSLLKAKPHPVETIKERYYGFISEYMCM